MLNYPAAFERYNLKPKGVIHVGGHVGFENKQYIDMGFTHRLFIEAQPDTFKTLSANVAGEGTFVENYAISDRNGTAAFFVADNQQSSSLLKMAKHSEVYPDIKQDERIEVRTIRLDDLINSNYSAVEFNFINMDIQGAELLALSGATQTIKNVDLINLEVNFDDLYTGAPHIRQLDSFLSAFDFIRVDTVLAHKTWGDALYVKNKHTVA